MQRFIRQALVFLGLMACLGAPALAQPIITISPTVVNPTCAGDTNGSIAFTLPLDSSNYLFGWSGGNAQQGLTQGLYRQSGLQPGLYTVFILSLATFTDTTVSVTLQAPPALLVSAGADLRACVGQAIRLTGSASAAGTFVWSYTDGAGSARTLSGSTVTIPGSGPGALVENTTTPIALTVTTPAGCSATDSLRVLVNPVPVANLAFSQPAICLGQMVDVSFTGTASADAVFSWIIVNGAGTFTANGLPTITGPGPHQILFTASSNGPLRPVLLRVTEPTSGGGSACQSIRSATVTVQSAPALSFTGLSPKYCINASATTLVPSPLGGVFKGPGVSGNVFDPATSGIGTHTIWYVFTTALGCQDSISQTTQVFSLPTASISGLDTAYCQGSAAVALNLLPAGGTLLGAGTRLPNLFYPDSAGIGTVRVRYAVADTNGCVDTASATTRVKRTPRLVMLPDTLRICEGGSAIFVLASPDAGATFAWTATATGTANGQADGSGPLIDQVITGNGTVTYLGVASLSGCSSAPQAGVAIVTGRPTAAATPAVLEVCSGQRGEIVLRSVQPGVTFSYTAAAVSPGIGGATSGSGDTIRVALTNSGDVIGRVRYLVQPSAGTCLGDTFSVYAVVQPIPRVVLVTADTTLCSGDSALVQVSGPVAGTQFAFAPTLVEGSATGFAPFAGSRLAQQLTNTDTVRAVVAYAITPTVAGCQGPAALVRVAVGVRPTLLGLSDTVRVCANTIFSVPLRARPVGATYNWTTFVAQGSVAGQAPGSGPALTGQLSGQGVVGYSIVPTLDGCQGAADTIYIQTDIKPTLGATPASASICSGTPVGVALSATPAGADIAWRPVANPALTGANAGIGTAINDTLRNLTRNSETIIYRAWAQAGACTSDTLSIPVSVAPRLQLAVSPAFRSLCSGDSVFLDLTADPATDATLGWRMFGDASLGNLVNGTGNRIAVAPTNADSVIQQITIRVGASNGCGTDSATAVLLVRPAPRLAITAPGPVCAGDTLRIAGSVVPRAADVRYSVGEAAGITGLTNGIGLPMARQVSGGGNYRLDFSANLNGCFARDTVRGLVNPAPSVPSIAASGPLGLCPGATVTLSTTATESLQWFRNDTLLPAPQGTAPSLVVNRAGIYRLVATSAAGCGSAGNQIIVTEESAPAAPVVSGDTAFCPGNTATLTTGPAARYQWLRAGVVLPNDTAQTLGGIAQAGTYAVVVFTSAGCADTSAPALVRALAAPAAPIVVGPVQICAADTLVLRLSGTGLPAWQRNGVTIAGAAADSLLISLPGIYTATLTDALGCTSLADTAEVLPGPIPPTPTLSGPNVVCQGDTVLLTSSVTDPAFFIRWLRNDTLLTSASPVLAASQPGLYQIEITRPGFCAAASDTFLLRAGVQPLPPLVDGPDTFCLGSQVMLRATAGFATYAWSRNDTLLASAVQDSLSVAQTGTYTVLVTNVDGCRAASAGLAVTALPAPSVTATLALSTICGAADGGIALTISGGSGRYGFAWTGSGVVQNVQNQTALRSGIYGVVVTDSATGCATALANLQLQDTAVFAAAANVQAANRCTGTSGRIVLTLDAAAGPYTFDWTGTGIGLVAGQQDQLSLAAGTYQVAITQTTTGCSRTLAGLVVAPFTPTRPTISGRRSLCGIGTTLLRSSAAIGNQWYLNGSALAGATTDTLRASVLGAYHVIDTTGGCNASSDTITIINSVPPARPTVSGDSTLCPGDTGTLTASTPVSGWLLDGAPLGSTANVLNVTAFGQYRAFVSDTNGCADTSAVFRVGPIRYNVSLEAVGTTNCTATDGRLIARYTASAATLLWKDATGNLVQTGGDTLRGLAPGRYRVVVQNGLCADSADAQISAPALLALSIQTSAANCGLADGSAIATVPGATPQITWYADNGSGTLDSIATGAAITGLLPRAYAAIAAEGFCRDTTQFTLSDTLRRTIVQVRPASACGLPTGVLRISSPSVLDSIVWKNAAQTILATTDSLVAVAGTYTVVFKAVGGCLDSSIAILSVGPAPRVAAVTTPNSTCFSTDGTATADFGPGATYAWYRTEGGTRTFVGSTATVANLLFGAYRVVSQNTLCLDSADVLVGRPANCGAACGIRLAVASNPVTCAGGTNGQVLALVTTGGSGQYQFRLNNAGAWLSSDSVFRRFNGLPAGSYVITVRDARDTLCSTSAAQVIGTQVTLSLLTQVDNGSCGSTAGGSVRVRVAGGVAPYRISLDSGTTFVQLASPFGDTTFANLAAGIYPLVVEDGTPCRTVAQRITIAPRNSIRPALTLQPVTCFGTATGGFRVNAVRNGTGSYTVRINGGTAQALRLDSTYTGLAAGNQTIFVTDVGTGCTFDTTLVLAQPARLVATVAIEQQPSCAQPDGQIRLVSATGGTAPYRFTLLRAGVLVNGPASFGDSLRGGLRAGAYVLRITDTAACADSVAFTLRAPQQNIVVAATPATPILCPGQPITFRSALNVPLPGVTYQWRINGAAISGATADTLPISTLANADIVDVVVQTTDTSSCFAGLPATSAPVPVRVLAGTVAASVSLSPPEVLTCPATPVTLQARNLAGITGATYAFYRNGAQVQAGTDSTYTLPSPSDGDSVFVVLTAPSGATCIVPGVDTSSVTRISVQSIIVANTTVTGSDTVSCQGQALLLRAASNLAGQAGFSVQWLRNGQPIANATSLTLAVAEPAGLYQYQAIVRLSNPAVCITGLPDTSSAFAVRFRPAADPRCRPCQVRLAVDTVLAANCAGQSNGQIRLQASGGTGRYEYGLLLNDTVRAYGALANFTGLAVGNYGFVVRDSLNRLCADTLRNIAVGSRTNLTATVVVTRLVPCAGTANGRIEVRTVTGGFGRYRYKIRNADTLTANNVFTGLRAGNYTVTVHDDSTRCTFVTAVRIDTAPPLRAFARVSRNVSCYGSQDAQITIDSVQNGSGGFAYSLVGPDTGYQPLALGQPISPSFGAGIRVVYVRDGNRCVAALSINVRQPDSLRLAMGALQRSDCAGPTGMARLARFGGGSGSLVYALLRPAATRPDTIRIPNDSTLRNLVGGDYRLTVTDSLGCTRSVAFRIGSDAPLARQITVVGNCPGGTNGQILLRGLEGGRRPYTFELQRADGFRRTQADSTFSNLTPGVYTIAVIDNSIPACTSSYTRTLSTLDTLRAQVVRFTPSNCDAADGVAILRITGGYPGYRFAYDSLPGTFTAFRPLVGDTLRISGLSARPEGVLHQIRLLDATDGGGCTGSFAFQLPGNTPLTYSLAVENNRCFGDASGKLVLNDVRGTGPLQVSVFDANTGQLVKVDSLRDRFFRGSQLTVPGLQAGTYNVQLSQYGPCSSSVTRTVILTQPPRIEVAYRQMNSTSPDYAEGEVQIDSITGGVGAYEIRTSDPGTYQAFVRGLYLERLEPGTLNLYVRDSNGCEVTRTLEVARDSSFNPTNVFSPNGDGINDTWIIKNLVPGTGVRVYNRWGRLVYQASPYRNDWDGGEAPSGVYIYELTPPQGGLVKGWVEILRNEGR